MKRAREDIEALVDSAPISNLDLTSIKKLVLKFEKAVEKNQLQRSKYLSEPTKFLESESDLDAEIKALTVLAGAPHFYPEIAQMGFFEKLLSLLAHDNSDIAISAVELLNAMTDEETVEIDSEEAKSGLESLVKHLVFFKSHQGEKRSYRIVGSKHDEIE